MPQYWLSRFLDYHAITSEEEAKKALLSPTVMNDLRRFARKAIPSLRSTEVENFSVVAGRGIDLSGQLDCRSDFCRIRQVNELFNHVWHYFDQIIVQDGVVHEVIYHWDETPEITRGRLLSHIKVLLYLRSIGAEDLVSFKMKLPPCTEHWQRHAAEAGLNDIISQVDEIANYIEADARINFEEDVDGVTKFWLAHPLISPSQTGRLDPASTADIEGSLSRKAVLIVVKRFVAHLTSDVSASSTYNSALGSVNNIHSLMLQKSRGITPTDVMLKLRLPVLSGLQPWDLIDIRKEEGEHFANFRSSLLLAVKERLKAKDYVCASEVAEEIRMDVIEPELTKIEARLKAAQRTMSKKSAVGLVLGTLSTTCGLLAGFTPEIATAGGTAVAISCTGAATAKYIDDVKDVSLSNMFFLWKAQEHTPH